MNDGTSDRGVIRLLKLRFRHRVAHIFISLTLMFVSGSALLGYLLDKPWHTWTGMAMAPNTAVCILLIAWLEFFEAFYLES